MSNQIYEKKKLLLISSVLSFLNLYSKKYLSNQAEIFIYDTYLAGIKNWLNALLAVVLYAVQSTSQKTLILVY
jgi:hypothetical protein